LLTEFSALLNVGQLGTGGSQTRNERSTFLFGRDSDEVDGTATTQEMLEDATEREWFWEHSIGCISSGIKNEVLHAPNRIVNYAFSLASHPFRQINSCAKIHAKLRVVQNTGQTFFAPRRKMLPLMK
jgi:hypothetical protein